MVMQVFVQTPGVEATDLFPASPFPTATLHIHQFKPKLDNSIINHFKKQSKDK